jgi:hypothetical protein
VKKKSKVRPLTAAEKARIDRELIESRAEPFADAAVIHKDNGDLLKMSKKLKGRRREQALAQLDQRRSGKNIVPIYNEIVLKHERRVRDRKDRQTKGRKTQKARTKAHEKEVQNAFAELQNRIEIRNGQEWPLKKLMPTDKLIDMLVEERHRPPSFYTPPRNDGWGLGTINKILKPKTD